MNVQDPRTEGVSSGSSPSTKKTYVAPAISWTEETEIQANLASACDKVGGSGGQCDAAGGS